MFRYICQSLIYVLILIGFSGAARAESHVALVIGNAAYETAAPLNNTINDAEDIANKLMDIGYDVDVEIDASFQDMRVALRDFARKSRKAEIALLYFAGHGIEVNKHNFLVPVDADLVSVDEVEFQAIPLHHLTHAVSGAKELSVVMLDACRDNPFLKSMQREASNRSVGSRGLAKFEVKNQQSIVSFAASEGEVASDGAGRNSPYAAAILTHLAKPNLEVNWFFRHVREDVLNSTRNQQEPASYNKLSTKALFLHPAGKMPDGVIPEVSPRNDTAEPSPDPRSQKLMEAKALWQDIKTIDDIAILEDFAKAYSGTFYAQMALRRVKSLKEEQRVAALPPPVDQDRFEPPPEPVRQKRSMMSIYRDVDLFGGDIKRFEKGLQMRSMDACASRCAGESDCRAFTFVPTQGKCYLKSGYENVQVFLGAYSGRVFQGYSSDDAPTLRAQWQSFYGRDLPTSRDLQDVRNVSKFSYCLQHCANNSSCRSVSYSAKLDRCWMKDRSNINPVRNSSAKKYLISSAKKVDSRHSAIAVKELITP